MTEDLEQGDVAETAKSAFEKSKHVKPQKKSYLTIQDVSHVIVLPNKQNLLIYSETQTWLCFFDICSQAVFGQVFQIQSSAAQHVRDE